LLASIVTSENRAAVDRYVERAKALDETVRSDAGRKKTGVFTGAYAIHPANGEHVPVWIADYILADYGSGAIMAVPAHDRRDYEFAQALGLPIVKVVDDGAGGDVANAPYEGDGLMVNSGFLNGLTVAQAKRAMTTWLEQHGAGHSKVTYRLRDWLFSRQRYWGEPIPVLRLADGSIVPLPEDALPLLPPELDDYKPAAGGEPPLARAVDWVQSNVPGTDIPAVRETNTMPQWAGSSWYFLRFLDPHNDRELVSKEAENYWMPVDVYMGGPEHTVLHLLYARFWHKVLYDIGLVSTKEPFRKLFNQGMVLAFSYKDGSGRYYEPEQVVERDGRHFSGTVELSRQVEKMSKSRFNVVNPDDVVEEYGADSLRLYEMFMGPLEIAKPWQTSGLNGVRRFLERVWRIVCDDNDMLHPLVQDGPDAPEVLLRLRHETVRIVTEDIEGLRFNTAISRLMEMANVLTHSAARPRELVEIFVKLLAPFAPHVAEELWRKLGYDDTLAYAPWPNFDPELAFEESHEYVVQVNGKVRHRFRAEAGLEASALIAAAKAESQVGALLEGRNVMKEIAIPGRLVNFVVRE
jgi:leucyl-tRNA synthetase